MKTFPIQSKEITNIPWGMIEPHRKQAYINHEQTLERLAERGGLDQAEAILVLTDQHIREFWRRDWSRSASTLQQLIDRYQIRYQIKGVTK